MPKALATPWLSRATRVRLVDLIAVRRPSSSAATNAGSQPSADVSRVWYSRWVQYHPDDFLRLLESVEDGGGAVLTGLCTPQRYKLKVEGKVRDYFTTGCRRESRFLIPYELPKGRLGQKMAKRGAGLVTACAVDDDMGKWPRFKSAVQEDSF